VAGILDVLANVAVIYGLRSGDLSVVSVLIALYPAGTILLANVVLRERIATIQWVGLGLALVASALLTL
jgi:drug/metabolite transporter (DMT)-like permease